MKGDKRDDPVRYLSAEPEEGQFGTIWLPEPPCPECEIGVLTREDDPQRKGAMYTCRNGCSARFWVDARFPR